MSVMVNARPRIGSKVSVSASVSVSECARVKEEVTQVLDGQGGQTVCIWM